MVSKIRQDPRRGVGVQVEVDCTGVHCYNSETDHMGDEVILTVSAPVSLRDDIINHIVYNGRAFLFVR